MRGDAKTPLMPQNASLIGLGWKIRIQEKRNNFYVGLAKELIIGNLLKRGDEIYYYLAEIGGRKAIITFLDSKPIETAENIVIKG